jgi:5-methylcytosine-specific restriction endonuclease McrA
VGNTQDHFTPRSVGKVLGWTRKQIESPENMQALSQVCHSQKDSSTPKRLEVLRMERRGVIYSFEEHRQLFAQFDRK